MAMPDHLVLLRHGESEANIVNHAHKSGESLVTDEFLARPDSQVRLTEKGVVQAQAAGLWIGRFILGAYPDLSEGFDLQFTTPLIRGIETAGNLGLPIKSDKARWRIDQRLRERYYGELRGMSREEHRARYPDNALIREIDPLYWQPVGGESVAQVADGRFRSILGTLADQRENHGVNSVMIVAHGEYLWAGRLCLMRMSNGDWILAEGDPALKIKNAQLDHYTKINPVTGERALTYGWMRSVCPWETPDDPGEWKVINPKRYTNDELLAIAHNVPPMDLPGAQAR